ncbi:MAG: tetratricopeptide repeat protein [Caldilineaceae bacterium]|nr:tetratricopeptide repeat protein [Caldilineaceae bacterium]
MKRYKEAEAYYAEGMTQAEAIGDQRLVSQFLVNLGVVTENQGLVEQAKEYYLRCLGLSRQLELRDTECAALVECGELYVKEDNWEAARIAFSEALAIAEIIESAADAAAAKYGLARVEHVTGNIEWALELARASLAIYEAAGHRAQRTVREWIDAVEQSRRIDD